MSHKNKTLIWDLPLRIFHWALALLIGYAWYSVEVLGDLEQHFLTGYAILTLLIFRVAWGFVGSRHARFASFVRGPAAIRAYLRGETAVGSYPGHNPLGALSVILMLVVIGAQATTGLFSDDQEFFFGPLSGYVSGDTVSRITEFHHFNFNVIMAVVVLHVLAIIYYSLVKKQRLVPAMVTGRKEDPDHALPGISGSKLLAALVVLVIAAAAVFGISTLGS